ncbi:uncharacterized protein [Miscanthus floridulus]|uniref:uncharacterized protein n=1 Tax=Miscanthus floridulus TaxID=154761 RepID=UPI00345B29EB
MGRFRRLINDLGLKEIPLHGRKFTWTNNHVSVKLDRVLCSGEWEELFSNCLLQSAASDDCDHCPLILGMNDIKPGKRRFQFKSFWPKLEGFQEAVEETIRRLQSRISWLSDGDANTALFHAKACYRKRKKFVAQLMLDGQLYTDHEKKAEIIDDFYSNLLGQSVAREHTINLAALGIPSHDLSEFDAPFSEEEVWNTIKLLPPDKAPGPDGFTGRFYRVCWPIIKKEVMEVGLQQFAPQATDVVFDDWWDRLWHAALEQQMKGLNSLVVLGALVLWTHRNSCVFDGATPSIARALNVTSDE